MEGGVYDYEKVKRWALKEFVRSSLRLRLPKVWLVAAIHRCRALTSSEAWVPFGSDLGGAITEKKEPIATHRSRRPVGVRAIFLEIKTVLDVDSCCDASL